MQPFTKSLTLTVICYIVTSLSGFIIYPLFGLSASISAVFTIGLAFTAIAFCCNYITLKVIEYFNKGEVHE
jgi:hypothetical protein